MNLFAKKKFIFSVLVLLLLFQLAFSFLYPSVGQNDNWQPISNYLPKFNVEKSDNFLLSKVYPLISPNYRLNSDVGHYLELGRNFSPQYFEGSPFIGRPLYPFLIFLISAPLLLFIEPSYGLTFTSAIFLNFILITAAALLFFALLRKMFSLKIAWLSSILLIFSPFVHSYISQPLAEMLMAFVVVVSACLIYNYAKNPSKLKLVTFSFIIGIFMLGKMFFAISFFILILAIYFKRYKEGAVFLAVHLIPLLIWYLWVTQIWQIHFFMGEVSNWQMGVWVFSMFSRGWGEALRTLLLAPVGFIKSLFYAFLFLPIVLALFGLRKMPLEHKNLFFWGALFSVFCLGFLVRFYYIRHVFLLFPVVYPVCVLGIESMASRFRSFFRPLFYVLIICFIVFISSINIYQVFNYNH